MYEDPDQVSLSCYCQVFLMFSVAAQFDHLDEADGVAHYEIGRKYMDDAVEEDPEDTVWVIKAMLLICFYQPVAKWGSVWMYLGKTVTIIHAGGIDLTVGRYGYPRSSAIST
jgi:hypothetical protein